MKNVSRVQEVVRSCSVRGRPQRNTFYVTVKGVCFQIGILQGVMFQVFVKDLYTDKNTILSVGRVLSTSLSTAAR